MTAIGNSDFVSTCPKLPNCVCENRFRYPSISYVETGEISRLSCSHECDRKTDWPLTPCDENVLF